jgi:hypothetical protein
LKNEEKQWDNNFLKEQRSKKEQEVEEPTEAIEEQTVDEPTEAIEE